MKQTHDDAGRVEEAVSRDDFLRLAADYQNLKKESEKRIADAIEFGKQDVLESILETLDTFEIARNHDEWTDGLDHAVTNLLKDLKQRYGLERIETEGRAFDPVTMEAVGSVSGGEENTVQTEQRAGWRMHDRVIRPARVIVFNH